MSFILLGIFLALAILVLSKQFPQIQNLRWYLVVPLILAGLAVAMVKVVPPGHVGVLILLGKVHGSIPEGLHLVNPLVSMELMNVRTHEIFEHAEVPSREGLNVVMEVSCLVHLIPEDAAQVYRSIGPNYLQVVVIPQFRSAIRGVTVRHESKDLYTAGREIITNEISQDLAEDLRQRGIELEKILLRRIQLPATIVEAINAKLAADQEAQRMLFVLEKEKLEANRKRIEAQGIQDFQKIVAQGLTDQVLRWKGIEATRALAESANSKIVIVGGRDGLPLILNTAPEALGPGKKD